MTDPGLSGRTAPPSVSAVRAKRAPLGTPEPQTCRTRPCRSTTGPHPRRASLYRAEFGSRWLTMTAEIVTAHGHIDATNADALTEYALGAPISRRELIPDLRGLGFCAAEGFSGL